MPITKDLTEARVKEELGKVIRALRRQRNITQTELAGLSRLHRTYLSDVERGSRNVSIESLARIAMALDVSLRDLFPTGDALDALIADEE